MYTIKTWNLAFHLQN